MPTRTARTAWDGGLEDGGGQVELTSSGAGTFDVSWPRRAEDAAEGTTSPEELMAAAHASCYSMQLSHVVAEAGGTPETLEVTAEVGFGPDPAGGFAVSGVTLRVRAEVGGISDDAFAAAADKAKETCPISKALAVPITLEIL